MDYEDLAKRIGTLVTGEAVTGADVQAELGSKRYLSTSGKLSPTEFYRLKVYAKRRAIKRLVDEAFAADAAMAKQKPAPRPATAQAVRRSELIEKAMATAPRRPLAMARGADPLYDPSTQARFKQEAWAVFRAGPVR